jgi:hypothetical protein
MDHIDETLTSQSINPKFEPSIRAALGLAKKTLNCYYSATDHSDVYRIAMGMSVTRGLRVLREQLFLRLLLTTCRASEYTLDVESCLGTLRQS